ncbi:MAG: primosomal protein N', partial [Luteibaculum sp.]
MRITLFADLILPLAIPNTYTYRVPFELNDEVAIGKRVLVSFGGSKMYSAIVYRIHEEAPKAYQAKYLDAVLDEFPIVNSLQLQFWEWLANYYMAYLGEIMLMALPASFRLASETYILPEEISRDLEDMLTPEEHRVYDALLMNEKMSLAEVGEFLDKKTVYPIIKNML